MSIDPEAIVLAKRFEPVMLFHPDERLFPIDPKLYLERSALWRTKQSDKKQDWGEPPLTTFPRRPQLAKGSIAALKNETGGGKTSIGKPSNLVIPEQETEVRPGEDRFLQLAGWEPFVSAPNEVTGTSSNRHPTLDANFYNAALQGGRPWYFMEFLNNQQLLSLTRNKTPNGLDLFRLVSDNRLSRPMLLVYHFFYALHEEPLRGCETAGEGQTFATYAGEWTSVSLLLDSARQPLFVGLTSRNVGDRKSIPAQENRLGMVVHPWKDVSRVGDHPKIFVSRGTHGNDLTTGPHNLKPFTPGDIDLNQGTCAEIEALDDVIPGGEEVIIPGNDADTGILLLKGIPTLGLGLFWATAEGAYSSFGSYTPAIEPNRKPQDETGGPLFGLIVRPKCLFVPRAGGGSEHGGLADQDASAH